MPTPHLAHGRRRGLIELVNENKLEVMAAYLPSLSSFLFSLSLYNSVGVCKSCKILGEVIMLI